MRKRRINPELLGLLTSSQWNDFTVAELKAAYMALPNCPHRSDKGAWQFVYRNIVRMEERGLLSSAATGDGERTRYRLKATGTADSVERSSVASASGGGISDNLAFNRLKEKLHHYKVEMLSAIGETEEYDAFCIEHPHMRGVVQALYNEARDRSSKTLGRVRALESILSSHFQCQQTP